MHTVMTIGNFDGVHRGHRKLVEACLNFRRQHSEKRLKVVVLTFEPHPVEVLKAPTIVPRLTPLDQKITLLENLGVDEVKVVPFTQVFSQISAKDFFKNILIQDLKVSFIAIGDNFFFGHNREGNPQKLIEWAKEMSIEAQVISPVEADGQPISSSRIRQLLTDGNVVAASRLLGRDFMIQGEVIHGDKRGRQLGFPTANVMPKVDGIGALCVPKMGVYFTVCTIDGRTFPAVSNIGVKPTVQKTGPLLIESHILDFSGDLYGKQLSVEFKDRIRDEKKFKNLDELKAQIQQDSALAREKLRLS